jgi:hypothetical protein
MFINMLIVEMRMSFSKEVILYVFYNNRWCSQTSQRDTRMQGDAESRITIIQIQGTLVVPFSTIISICLD